MAGRTSTLGACRGKGQRSLGRRSPRPPSPVESPVGVRQSTGGVLQGPLHASRAWCTLQVGSCGSEPRPTHGGVRRGAQTAGPGDRSVGPGGGGSRIRLAALGGGCRRVHSSARILRRFCVRGTLLWLPPGLARSPQLSGDRSEGGSSRGAL